MNKKILIFVLILIVAGAAGVWYFVLRETPEPFYDYSAGEALVINPYESGSLLKVAVVLRLNTDKAKVIEEVFTQNHAKLRDKLIAILREYDDDALLDPAMAVPIKQRITEDLNTLLESSYITDVYFNDFVVQ